MIGRFWKLARPQRRDFIAGFALLVATNALALAIPWLLRSAIRAIEQNADARRLALLALGMVVLAFFQAWARTYSRLSILGASRRISYDLRDRFFARLRILDAAWYDRQRTGDIMSRGVNDIQIVQAAFGPGAMNLINTAIVYVGVLVLLVWLDPFLTACSLVLLPALYFGVNRISRGVHARSIAVQEQLGAISNRTQEALSGIQQIQIFGQEPREAEAFRELCGEYRRRNLALARLRGAMIALIGVLTGVGTLAVLWIGGRRVIAGSLPFADFVAFNAYLAMLVWPTVALGWIVNVFQRAAGALDRLDEVLEASPVVPAPTPATDGPAVRTDSPAHAIAPIDGAIEIRGLTFAYGGAASEALRDVHLAIPRGSRVAIVGPVGSGKSTLVHLLARVYAAPKGTIFLDGRDLLDYPVETVRRSIGLVPQEAFLFSRSLKSNVAFGRPEASDAEVDSAVQLSRLSADLPQLPSGIETVVGERGFTLSGGQRQRATLARAALIEPTILLLDDSLSSVDADTERAILENLDTELHGRTCLLVTHRASTLASMDRIVVLDEGRVVEDGSHRELLENNGVYSRLFHRQLLQERLDSA